MHDDVIRILRIQLSQKKFKLVTHSFFSKELSSFTSSKIESPELYKEESQENTEVPSLGG